MEMTTVFLLVGLLLMLAGFFGALFALGYYILGPAILPEDEED